MSLKEFSYRVSFVTFCAGLLLYMFLPTYEFIDSTHRVNTLTGKSEYHSSRAFDYGWHQ